MQSWFIIFQKINIQWSSNGPTAHEVLLAVGSSRSTRSGPIRRLPVSLFKFSSKPFTNRRFVHSYPFQAETVTHCETAIEGLDDIIIPPDRKSNNAKGLFWSTFLRSHLDVHRSINTALHSCMCARVCVCVYWY
jgi:hypothetical protein